MFVSRARFKRMKEWADSTHKEYVKSTRKLMNTMLAHAMLRDALKDILAQKTDKPNATVVRIVRIAEEALENYGEASSG